MQYHWHDEQRQCRMATKRTGSGTTRILGTPAGDPLARTLLHGEEDGYPHPPGLREARQALLSKPGGAWADHMHELGIAQSVLEAVSAEAVRHHGARPVKVAMRIGELAAVDPEALRFAFEALIVDTELEGLELEIETCPRRHRCLDCSTAFLVQDFAFECTHCGSTRNQCISGEKLELAYLELEEYEPSTA